ncbi:class II glutamine amidotransferase, partial [Escherichia sp. TWPC-MK]
MWPGSTTTLYKSGETKDGWGITFYEGKGCRTFKDPQPSFN